MSGPELRRQGVSSRAPLVTSPRIGLALSGGGSRAIAFHLGCLRALHRAGLIDRLDSLSTVSGGSVIGALYACHEGDFAAFESRINALLKRGLVRPTLKTAFTTRYGVFAFLNWLLLIFISVISIPFVLISHALSAIGLNTNFSSVSLPLRVRRLESRTTLLARTLDSQWFHGKTIDQVKKHLMINACDLTHGSAFYFSPSESGSWRLGRLSNNKQLVAEAVAASAAYPLALPALDKKYRFTTKSGDERIERVSLTDGGVYDNTALSPFWPSRDKSISLAVFPVSSVIACRAGYGSQRTGFAHFLVRRLQDAYTAIQNRAENASIQRLFEYRKTGAFDHVVLPFLGQQDTDLTHPPPDLVSRESVWAYPTNFNAMDDDMITRLALRGEQLTSALLQQHGADLLASVGADGRPVS